MSITNPRIRAIISDHRLMLAGIEITLTDWKELAKLYTVGVTSSNIAVAAGIATKVATAATVAVNTMCLGEHSNIPDSTYDLEPEDSSFVDDDGDDSDYEDLGDESEDDVWECPCPWYGLSDDEKLDGTEDVTPGIVGRCPKCTLPMPCGKAHSKVATLPPRVRRKPVRFSEQKEHYHAGFGGSRGSNNEHTSGEVIDDGEWVCKHEGELHGGEYSDCIGCESGSTCDHWHDPIPRKLHGLKLEEWWEKQWYRYKSETGRRAAYECW